MWDMRLLALPPAFLAVAVLAACGTAGGSDVESELEGSVRDELRGERVEVDCPDDLEVGAGAAFECRASVDGRRGVVLVSRKEDDGPVRWRLKPVGARAPAP